MSIKTKKPDLLEEANRIWSEILDLQRALAQLENSDAVSCSDLIAALNEKSLILSRFIAKRIRDESLQAKENVALEKVLKQTGAFIKAAEALIAKLEDRESKPARSREAKMLKTTPPVKFMRLAPRDSKLLEIALMILKGEKGDWEYTNWLAFDNGPVTFLEKCFGKNATIYVVGVGHLSFLDYVQKGYLARDLARICSRYEECFTSQFVTPTNEATKKLFDQVIAHIGHPEKLKMFFERMLGTLLGVQEDETEQGAT